MRAPIVDRRTVLRGIGATIALPWLEAMAPRGLAIGRAAAAMSVATARPARTAFLFFPNGVNPSAWPTPMDGLTTWHATGALEPLAEFRGRIAMHTGLTHANAAALGDGPGDHARSAACFLTGAHRARPPATTFATGGRSTRRSPMPSRGARDRRGCAPWSSGPSRR